MNKLQEDRILTSNLLGEDLIGEPSLRPLYLKDYVGQEKIKENISIFVSAARERRENLDHVLLSGPPGLGKTTLAAIIASEMNTTMKKTSGPAIERPGDLAAILTNMEAGDVLFIDEIHRLNRSVEEMMYSAMEDYALDIIIGKGPAARTLRLELQPFTLIGATTRPGLLTSPLRDRFGINCRLDYYSDTELTAIIKRTAKILCIDITGRGAAEIARRSRGTPRIANRLLKRVRDYALVKEKGIIEEQVADQALGLFEIDEHGLDNVDRMIIEAIINKFSGGPVGLETLSACVSEEPDTLTDVYEPYLLKKGFLQRTPRGRIATENAYRLVALHKPPASMDPALFEEPGRKT